MKKRITNKSKSNANTKDKIKYVTEISLDKPIFKILEEYCKDVKMPSFFIGLSEGRIFNALETAMGKEDAKILLQTVTQAYIFAGVNFAKRNPKQVHIKYGHKSRQEEITEIAEITKTEVENSKIQYVG